MLKGKHIVLGICGGIAAYKSVTLLRLLTKAGAEVQVVMTPAGKEFITPVTLSSLSQRPVVSEFFTANTGQWNSHVPRSALRTDFNIRFLNLSFRNLAARRPQFGLTHRTVIAVTDAKHPDHQQRKEGVKVPRNRCNERAEFIIKGARAL